MTTRGILVPKHRLERLTLTLEPFRPLFQALAQRDPLEAASLLNTRPFGEHGPSLGDLAVLVLAATETAMAIREAEAGPTRRTLPLPKQGRRR